jgi:hypothetical protein
VGFGDDRLDGECPCCFGFLQFGSWGVSEALFYSLSLCLWRVRLSEGLVDGGSRNAAQVG